MYGYFNKHSTLKQIQKPEPIIGIINLFRIQKSRIKMVVKDF